MLASEWRGEFISAGRIQSMHCIDVLDESYLVDCMFCGKPRDIFHIKYKIFTVLPTQLVSGAVVLQAEAVGLAHPVLASCTLLVGARWHDGFPPPLPAQHVRAGTEEQSEAVLLGYSLQEAPQGFVTFLAVAAVVGGGRPLGARHDVFGPQRATFLVKAAVLSCLQALVLTIQRRRGS